MDPLTVKMINLKSRKIRFVRHTTLEKVSKVRTELRMSVWRITFLALSTFGLIVHTVQVTIDYLKFEVLTQISYDFVFNRTMPSVTIGLLLLQFIDYNKLSHLQPDFVLKFHEKFPLTNKSPDAFLQTMREANGREFLYRHLFDHLRVPEIIKLLYPLESFVTKVDLPHPKGHLYLSEEGTQKLCQKQIYFKEKLLLILINCNQRENFHITKSSYDNQFTDRGLISIVVNNTFLNEMTIANLYLHPPDTLLHRNQLKAVAIPTSGNPKVLYFTYRSFYNKLLPAPYTTDCYDYTKDGFASQINAQEECENQKAIQRLGSPYNNNIFNVSLDVYHPIKYFKYYEEHKETMQLMQTLPPECGKYITRQDCESEYLIPTFKYSTDRMDNQNSKIVVQWPSMPDVFVLCSPRFTFVDYAIFLGSIGGTWFGFNIAFSLPSVINALLEQRKRNFLLREHHPLREHWSPRFATSTFNFPPTQL